MADDVTVSRAYLLALRELFGKRAARAHAWFDEFDAQLSEPAVNAHEALERVAELRLFFLQLATDFTRWEKTLGAILEEN